MVLVNPIRQHEWSVADRGRRILRPALGVLGHQVGPDWCGDRERGEIGQCAEGLHEADLEGVVVGGANADSCWSCDALRVEVVRADDAGVYEQRRVLSFQPGVEQALPRELELLRRHGLSVTPPAVVAQVERVQRAVWRHVVALGGGGSGNQLVVETQQWFDYLAYDRHITAEREASPIRIEAVRLALRQEVDRDF